MLSNEGFLRLTVEEDLAAYQTANAVFVAEKLVAAFPSAESKHLLARAYLQADDTQRAFCTLYPASTSKNRCARSRSHGACTPGLLLTLLASSRYLLAICAKKLGKLKEAEMALQGGGFGADGAPHEAYAHELMGEICK
jgi:hypothetical protein